MLLPKARRDSVPGSRRFDGDGSSRLCPPSLMRRATPKTGTNCRGCRWYQATRRRSPWRNSGIERLPKRADSQARPPAWRAPADRGRVETTSAALGPRTGANGAKILHPHTALVLRWKLASSRLRATGGRKRARPTTADDGVRRAFRNGEGNWQRQGTQRQPGKGGEIGCDPH